MQLRPFLIVGVGGSGGKTVRVLRDTVLRTLRVAGWEKDRLPLAWQVLWIDSITVMGDAAFPASQLSSSDYLGLVPAGMSYPGLRASLVQALPSQKDRMDALSSWLPEDIPVPITMGAGQYRSVGRAIAAQQLTTVVQALKAKTAIMALAEARIELGEVNNLPGIGTKGSSDGAIPGAAALVIGSIAGGSGSGMLQDVSEALKAVGLDETAQMVAFGPDVFEGLAPGSRAQIPANSFAAVTEVVWGARTSEATSGTKGLLASAGVSSGQTRWYGTPTVFIMGAQNNITSFGSQDDVYRAAGAALAPIMVDPSTSFDFLQYSWANSRGGAGVALNQQDLTAFKDSDQNQIQPMWAVGGARVGLGLARFERFLVEVASRDAVEMLLWPWKAPDPIEGPVPETVRVAEQADAWFPAFLGSSGLEEKGRDNNQVLDELLPEGWLQAQSSAFAAQVLQRVQAADGGQGLPASQWLQNLQADLATYQPRAVQDALGQIQARGRDWVSGVTEHLVRHTTFYTARYGFLVTAELTKRLATYVHEVASSDLQAEAQQDANYAMGSWTRLTTVLAGADGKGAASRLGGQQVDALVRQDIAQALAWQILEQVKKQTSLVLLDLEANLLNPLKQTIESTHRSVLQVAQTNDSAYSFWPAVGGEVPKRLLPLVTEQVMIDPSMYSQHMREQIRNGLPKELKGNTNGLWQRWLRERVTQGLSLEAAVDGYNGSATDRVKDWKVQYPEEVKLFDVIAPWAPMESSFRPVGQAAGPLKMAGPLSDVEVLDHVERSIELDSTSQLGKFLRQGLENFLADQNLSPADQQTRMSEFENKLLAALQHSAPMAKVDATIFTKFVEMKGGLGSLLFSTPIPSSLEPIYRKVRPSLDASISDQGVRFDAPSGIQDVAFLQGYQSPTTPFVFSSLMDPIRKDWGAIKADPQKRKSWFDDRKSRPMLETLPVSRGVLEDMTRGWYLARWFGLINATTPDGKSNLGTKVTVLDEYGRPLDFPHPLVGWAPGQINMVASILHSSAIALLEATNAGVELETALGAHWRLINLGRLKQEADGQSTVKDLISEWVLRGKSPAEGSVPPENRVGSPSGTAEERKAALSTTVSGIGKTVAAKVAEIEDAKRGNAAIFATEPIWEIRDLVIPGLSSIAAVVESIDTGGGNANDNDL